MLKKAITYTDYNGTTRTEHFYFNLTKAELIKMDLLTEGGMEHRIGKMIETRDNKEIIELIDSIILSAYGEKSADGKRFVKSEAISEAFKQTEAYSELFLEMLGNTEAIAEFINSIVPADIQQAVAQNKTEIPNLMSMPN